MERDRGEERETPKTTYSRRTVLKAAGLGAAGAALAGSPLDLLRPEGATAAKAALNVTYWSTVTPKQDLLALFAGFTKQTGMPVNYIPLPPVFADDVQKLTTYLSSGYTGIDVLWLDDFMTASFSTAGWLEPLESVIPRETITAIVPGLNKLSTYNGHLYRIAANFGAVLFFYNKTLFAKAGVSVPGTWQELVKVGKTLTTGGRYAMGMVGKVSAGELFNEMSVYLKQAGGDTLHLTTPQAKTGLKFMYDLIHTYKIVPPTAPADDYTALDTYFQNGHIAIWPTWDGFMGTFNPKPGWANVGIAYPPKGPANNQSIAAAWGWSVSKYSPNKDMAIKFIQYAASAQAEDILAGTASTPARLANLSDPVVKKALRQAPFLSKYAGLKLTGPRSIRAQIQRISEVIEQAINPYLNGQVSLDAAVTQAQQGIDQIAANS
jgi:multiple sugar transport system substrate-binding protein